MKSRKSTNSRFRRIRHYLLEHFSWNIGTVIFLALFIYILISLIIYLTANKITSYQVTTGPLNKNDTVQALAIRSETVVNANTGGYINYYIEDESKVKNGAAVFSVSSEPVQVAAKDLSAKEVEDMKNRMKNYSMTYEPDSFDETYDLKYALKTGLYSFDNSNTEGMDINTTASDGIVVFGVDGLEGLTKDEITPDLFNEKVSSHLSHAANDTVDAGQAVYKLINDANWKLYFPLTDKQTVKLADYPSVKIKFLKDGASETGGLSILTIGDRRYAEVSLSKGMVRYAKERFLDVEIVTNTTTGLKIPKSAIVKKDFYIVPASFLADPTGSQVGFRKVATDKNGKVTSEYLQPSMYETTTDESSGETLYYIDKDTFSAGDKLINQNGETYVLKDTIALDGVYEVNKGYAVFRRIKIADQNEEYCIIEMGTTYGLSQYDFIAQDASSVSERELTAR